MNNAIKLLLLTTTIAQISIAMDNPRDTVDIRKAWLEFPHNKQDENGNTFWHNLAFESEHYRDWSEVTQKENTFKQDHKNWLPNPLIKNNAGRTARQQAKDVFNRSGNPVGGLLVIYLRQSEEGFLNKVALSHNRELMDYAQHVDCEVAKKLSIHEIKVLVAQLPQEGK